MRSGEFSIWRFVAYLLPFIREGQKRQMSMLEFISIRRSLSVWGLSLSIACLQVVGAAAEPASYLIDQIADDAMEDHNLAGISIAVAQGQIVTHAKGYGKADLQHDVDAKPNTVFRIGSVTKQFTAAAKIGRASCRERVCSVV